VADEKRTSSAEVRFFWPFSARFLTSGVGGDHNALADPRPTMTKE
jgi:hypothetical protein